MPTTIGDVARRAGVGVGTVSRVLNNQPKVGPETRARVLAAIAELDYVPSATARQLSLRRTNTIAVASIHIVIPSVIERIHGIERALTAAGLDLIIRNVETVERRNEAVREIARTDRIDGAIFISLAPGAEELARIRRSGLPVVLIDAHHRSVPRVVSDDVEGGRLVGRHLLELGHTRIGFVGDPPRPALGVQSSRMRLRGVIEALQERGLGIAPEHIVEGEHSRAGGQDSARTILSRPDPPTAIVAANDTLAFGVLAAARERGLDVPRDLSVVGYDDIDAADLVQLTTMHQPLRESGTEAVRRLLAILDGTDNGPLRSVLPVHLVKRGTTAPAPERTA
ncbi:LacI family DNA-binding transcriptional regulator [Actinoplanes subtropicus]|uniref:LacI family DNA-binding transcriptional regulator n=1 Tax=Actinoplanes subtropicus TaxID=543632 RepID=UPI0014704F30|nr:LacI family DNA-binding transcriptional regulator [Actinoplanes subtropicus]